MATSVSWRIINRTPASLLAGAALAGTLFTALSPWPALAVTFTVSAVLLFIFRKEPYSLPLYALVFTLFAAWTAYLKPACSTAFSDMICGSVEEVTVSPRSQRAYVNTAAHGRIAIIVTDIIPEISEGDKISFRGTAIAPKRNDDVPFYTSRRLNAMASRISGTFVVRPDGIDIIGQDSGLYFTLLRYRRQLADKIHASPLSPEAAGLLSTAIFATDDVGPDIKNNFRITGLSHLLCVSGFHVGVVAAFVLLLLSPLRLTGRRMALRYALAATAIWLYALLVGMSASVTRAAVMLTVFAIAKIIQRRVNPLNTLMLAFCAVLSLNPWQLFSAGFQLSFAAVAGILLLARKLNPFAEHRHLFFKTAAVFTVPLAAMLATAPFMLLWFQRMPLLTVPMNAAGTLIFPFFIVVSATGLFLWHAGLPSAALIQLSDKLFGLLERLVDTTVYVSGEYSLTMLPTMTELLIIALLTALIMYAFHFKRHRRAVLAIGLCLMSVLAGCRLRTPAASIYIDGDSRSTDIVLARRGVVAVFTTSSCNYPLTDITPVLAFYGCDSATVSPVDTIIDATGVPALHLLPGNGTVLVATKHTAKAAKTNLSPKTQHLVIGADVDPNDRLRLIRACMRCSVPYSDLREQAYFRFYDN
ncbi:MAG: ComEC/Rec2 family competence protein [Muribaculaceae bacterium]|jgi:ComEC/Rec2-related protein|nr:ComEC/Rec2 family competence protein [Muribaculaceae bacterium]